MVRRTIGLLAVLSACIALIGSSALSAIDPRIQKLKDQAGRAFAAGEFQAALDIYREVLHLAQNQGDIRAAGRASTNIGAAQLAMSRYQDAITAFLDGERRSKQARDPDNASAAAFNLASLYIEVNDLDAADRAAERGLAASRDPFGYRSILLRILGKIRVHQRRPDEAIDLFHQAIQAAVAKHNRSAEASAWDGLGEGLLIKGDLTGAEDAFQTSCAIRLAIHDRDLRVSYLKLSQTKLLEGDARSASRLLDQATSLPATGVTFDLWSIDQLRGKILLADKRPVDALAWFRKSIEASRSWTDHLVQNDAVRTTADEWFHQLYCPFIETSIDNTPPPHLEALLATEENRAASLRHTLTASRAFLTRVPPEYWQIMKRLRLAESQRLAKNTPAAKAQVANLRQTLNELEAKAGVHSISTSGNKTIENNGTVVPLGIQGGLTKGEVLLSFYLGSKSSALWAVTDRGCEFHSLPAGIQISEEARRFSVAVETGSPERDNLAAKLYAQLFSELSPEARAKPDWIISAADDLFDIPMAALVTGRKQGAPTYLAEEHSIYRVPSALMLRQPQAEPATGQFLGIGDGIYNVADSRYAPPKRSGSPFGFVLSRAPKPSLQLARLVGSDREIQTCSRIWGGSKTPVLLTGTQATRERFESELPSRPSVIHIATHVMAPPGSPEQAVINFGLSAEGQTEVLTNSDIATLDVSGSTVVMNGCASAGATAVSGAGVMGLTRAWILAGARTVIGARWPVSDDTGVLFESFYFDWKQNRENGPRRTVIAKALQQAQIQALRSNTWRSDPKYWSAFYALGKD